MQDERARQETEAVAPGDLSAMLTLIQHQQRRTEHQLFSGFALIPTAFGAAWLLGYALLFTTIRPDPLLPLGQGAALSIYFVLLALAGTCTSVVVVRSSRGLRGGSQNSGTMYGISWMVGMAGVTTVLGAAMPLGVSPAAADLLWSAMPGLVAGMLFLSGGAVFSDVRQFYAGLWVVLSTTASAFAGVPNHYLVMSLAGGGGLLLFGLAQIRADFRANRALQVGTGA